MSSPRFNRLKNMRVMPVASRRCELLYIMAGLNIPANDALVEQAPAVAPPTRTDDQILPLSKWVPIGKSNCFWDTMCFNTSTGLYSCQLDEQWFNLHKDLLRGALDITPTNDNNPFVAPPSSDTVIEYVNTLGYPSKLRNVSAISVNALYQPWRVVLSMINMCLTGKTVGYDRPRHHVLQILWGIIHRSNIDYAERIWEEFVQSIQTFLTEGRNRYNTLTYSEMKLDEEMPVINTGDQDEGQAGPNPGKQDEGQAGLNPGIQDEGQAGSNLGEAVES
ncbi:hypothetical protein Tco_0091743 [Tanacetum coccineum]